MSTSHTSGRSTEISSTCYQERRDAAVTSCLTIVCLQPVSTNIELTQFYLLPGAKLRGGRIKWELFVSLVSVETPIMIDGAVLGKGHAIQSVQQLTPLGG
jgi:hypothetical protein